MIVVDEHLQLGIDEVAEWRVVRIRDANDSIHQLEFAVEGRLNFDVKWVAFVSWRMNWMIYEETIEFTTKINILFSMKSLFF